MKIIVTLIALGAVVCGVTSAVYWLRSAFGSRGGLKGGFGKNGTRRKTSPKYSYGPSRCDQRDDAGQVCKPGDPSEMIALVLHGEGHRRYAWASSETDGTNVATVSGNRSSH